MSEAPVASTGSQPPPRAIGLSSTHGFHTLPVTTLGTLTERLSALINSQSNGTTVDADTVDFVIPLAPFERRLLDILDKRWSLSASFSADSSFEALLPHLFHNWSWSYKVQSYLQASFSDDEDPEKCDNNQQMYEKGLHRLASASGYGREKFRITPLQDDNDGFIERLGSKPFWLIRFKPFPDDIKYWGMLTEMFLRNQQLMLFWMNVPERRRIFSRRNERLEWHCSHYHICEIVRIFDLWSRRPSNSEEITSLFSNQTYSAILKASLRNRNEKAQLVEYAPARDAFKGTETRHTEEATSSAESPHFLKFTESLDRMVNANGVDSEVIFESQMGTMRWNIGCLVAKTIRPIDIFQDDTHNTTREKSPHAQAPTDFVSTAEELHFEPGSYLELVDWDELVPVNLEDLSQRALQDLQDSRLEVPYELMTWTNSEIPCIGHHFMGEESLLQQRLCNDFDDAGDCDNKHVFVIMDLNGSLFCADYLYYWAVWNDSAIAIEPATKKLKLLTTPRGCRYRRIYADFDHLAALRSQRREVDLINTVKDTQTFLRRTLGASYKPEYDTMLGYIPAEQITVLDPVGAGSFGSVVRATWQRPRSLEHEMPEAIDVVLKRLNSDFQADKAFNLFIHELRVTYSGLIGASSGCTEFYGVTEVNSDSFPNIQEPGTCLCFVFERANQGPLLKYIEQKCLSESWPEVASAMAGLFGGLNTLHQRNVLHRDIHPGNILWSMERSGYSGTEPSVLLCDFGLGKIIRDSSGLGQTDPTTGTMQTNLASSAYKAPEVRRGKPYTKAADVYAAGVFMKRAFQSFQRIASAKGVVRLPRKLWNLCEKCTAFESDERPTAIQAVFEMESVHDDDFADGKLDLVDMRDLVKQKVGVGKESDTSETQEWTEVDSDWM